MVYAVADTNVYANAIGIYLGYKYFGQAGNPYVIIAGCKTQYSNIQINIVEKLPYSSGSGGISGNIMTVSKKKNKGQPVTGVMVYIDKKPDDKPMLGTLTNNNGDYTFDSIADGTYDVIVDIPCLPLLSHYTVTINGGNHYYNRNYVIDSNTINVDSATVGIKCAFMKNSTVSIFPNPNNGLLSVKLTNVKNNELQISIFDITGKQIYFNTATSNGRIFNTTIDVSNYTSGVYQLVIQNNDEVFQTKFVK